MSNDIENLAEECGGTRVFLAECPAHEHNLTWTFTKPELLAFEQMAVKGNNTAWTTQANRLHEEITQLKDAIFRLSGMVKVVPDEIESHKKANVIATQQRLELIGTCMKYEKEIKSLRTKLAMKAEAIQLAQIASCSCQTKTNEASYHSEHCIYRILAEALNDTSEEVAKWEASRKAEIEKDLKLRLADYFESAPMINAFAIRDEILSFGEVRDELPR